jgi:MFS family permease
LASRYAANNERLQLKALASAFIASGALTVCVYLTTNLYWALTLMGLAAALHNAAGGPVFATIQTLVPDRMRALAFSFVYLMANLIGAGFGPLTTGLLSDVFAPWAGHQSLRYALLALTPGYLWMAWYTWRASQSVQRDLEPIAVNEAATAASN